MPPRPSDALEAALHYPLADRLPAPGEAFALEEIAPGVRWIRMALPFALDHINLWLLEDELDGIAGWTVVDCCVDLPHARAQWETIFETQLGGRPILRVVVTHMHPDHIGLAHWLCDRWKVPLWISATDFNAARIACRSTTGHGGPATADFFASHGLVDADKLGSIRSRSDYYPSLVPAVPASYRRLLDGMTLDIGGRAWRCIVGYGHAPEHMALFCERTGVLIGGDMMLPRISTNVSVYEIEPESDALRLFLDSIEKFRALPEGTLTLPSHGKPFKGLHTRIDQLQDHHRDRLAEVLAACAESPRSAAEMLPVLFKRELDAHQTSFAMGESIAHLHALWFAGRVRRARDAQGVWRFGVARA